MLNLSLHAHYNDTTLGFFQKHAAGNMPEQPTMLTSNPALELKQSAACCCTDVAIACL
jgi:hypothetical protein